jgi:predicted ribosome quality control (RQC) complex YloA/Tae2 family protein
MKVDIDLTISA